MPSFRKRVIFSDLVSSHFLEADAVVDSGADYSQLPEEAASYLGLTPAGSRGFHLANAAFVERPWTNALVALSDTGDRAATVVVIGEPGTPVILGCHALDALGLGIDTKKQRLIPKVDQLLLQTGWPTV